MGFYLFIYLFFAACGLSLVEASKGYSSFQWLLLLQSTGSRHASFSSCSLQALECRLSGCGCLGLLDLWHVGSSQTRDWTGVPCIAKQIFNHQGNPGIIFKSMIFLWKLLHIFIAHILVYCVFIFIFPQLFSNFFRFLLCSMCYLECHCFTSNYLFYLQLLLYYWFLILFSSKNILF